MRLQGLLMVLLLLMLFGAVGNLQILLVEYVENPGGDLVVEDLVVVTSSSDCSSWAECWLIARGIVPSAVRDT